jgi:protein-S-isoprenylcysteine O-methyltransferase Ste14
MLIRYLFLSAILILFSYLVFRVIVRNDYLKKLKLTPLSYFLELLVFAGHANLMYTYISVKWPNLPSLPDSLILGILFIIVFCLGLTILLIAWFRLGTGTSFGIDKNKLNSGGIYRYSRNPQLIGYGVLLLSFIILSFSWYSIGWFIQYVLISYFMIKSEEEFLSLRYGEEYKRYCNSVPRIIKLF